MISTMINQSAVEALYSASYIEDYLDCVENLPGELQRSISRLREIEMTFDGLLRDVEQQSEMLLLEADFLLKKRLMTKIEQALISTQELGDEKLQILQHVQDLVENRTRQLDLDYRNLADVGKEPDIIEPPKEINQRETNPFPSFNLNNGGSSGERQSKRVRRTRNDILTHTEVSANLESIPTPEPARQVQQMVQQSSPAHTPSSNSQKKPSVPAIGKKKKRKSRQSGQATLRDSQSTSGRESQRETPREESPPRDDEMLIDPDEPTYCLCDQISYGEMIMCDNDLCPFEWFHFSCVSLGVKPKGKWYCPKCRGDRSSIMKPKAQLMKELERVKQERESKEDKSS